VTGWRDASARRAILRPGRGGPQPSRRPRFRRGGRAPRNGKPSGAGTAAVACAHVGRRSASPRPPRAPRWPASRMAAPTVDYGTTNAGTMMKGALAARSSAMAARPPSWMSLAVGQVMTRLRYRRLRRRALLTITPGRTRIPDADWP
jgi:hypothetical protein